jgi:uncharacterized protein (DUF1697 family)
MAILDQLGESVRTVAWSAIERKQAMKAYVALLRAVNLGGSTTLPMTDLRAMCEASGFAKVSTYIASGNALFESEASEKDVKSALEAKLFQRAGRPIEVLVRALPELAATLAGNPFPEAPANIVHVIFLDAEPPAGWSDAIRHQTNEVIAPGPRAIYVHYPTGAGRSKLVIPAAKTGTARNMNTVAKLVDLLRAF